MSDNNYISAKKAKRLTRAYEHKYNFIYWEIVDNDGNNQPDLKPGRWVIVQHCMARTAFLKVEKDMTLTEYLYVKEDEA
jgi:hypothetical protein